MQAGTTGIIIECFDSLRADQAAFVRFLETCTKHLSGHGLLIYSRTLVSVVPDWLRGHWLKSIIVDQSRMSEPRLLRLCTHVYIYDNGVFLPFHKDTADQSAMPDILGRIGFIASNGTGLGHVMRLLSIAEGLKPFVGASYFMSYSAGLTKAAQTGAPVYHLASSEYLSLDYIDSYRYVRESTQQFITVYKPTHLVYDGNIVPMGLWGALAAYPDIHFTWVRRGMWRAGAAPHSIVMQALADVVLEPGDIAGGYDQGATIEAMNAFAAPRDFLPTPPIRSDVLHVPLGRIQALTALELDITKRYALIMLGAMRPDDKAALERLHRVVSAVLAQRGIVPVIAHWPIAHALKPVIEGAHVIELQPLAPFYAAFDIVISAAGYNSFHELMATDRPVIFIPNIEVARDMQEVRARYASDYMLAAYMHPNALEYLPELISKALLHGPKMRHTINWLTDWAAISQALGLKNISKDMQQCIISPCSNTQQNTALWMPRLWTIFRKKREWGRNGHFAFIFALDVSTTDCMNRLQSGRYNAQHVLIITNSVDPVALRRKGYKYVWANMDTLQSTRQRDRWMLRLCSLWRPNKMKVF